MAAEAYAALSPVPRGVALGRFAAPALAPATGFVAVVGVAAAGGGYFPTAWGLTTLAFLALAAAALVRPRPALAALDRLFLAALAGLAGWTALSIARLPMPMHSAATRTRSGLMPSRM